jgi:hypothetical protein
MNLLNKWIDNSEDDLNKKDDDDDSKSVKSSQKSTVKHSLGKDKTRIIIDLSTVNQT